MSLKTSIPVAYASSLFTIAEAEDCLERTEAELFQLKELLKVNTELKVFLQDSLIAEEGKEKALEDIFGKKVLPIIVNFLKLVVIQGKVKLLSDIIDEFFKLSSSTKGKINAEVITSVTITEEVAVTLRKKLSEVMGKEVTIKATVDEKIIGGIIVKLGDKIIDASLQNKLKEVQKCMTSS